MKHPFTAIQPTSQKRWLIGLVVASLAVLILLNAVSQPLVTPAASQGIISFELAGNPTRAAQILASWDGRARLSAAFGLGFDYVFMLVYSTTLSLACIMAGGVLRQQRWHLASLRTPLAWVQWVAAFFDALENIALLAMLFNQPVAPWPWLAQICAVFKFLLIFLGLVYAFLGLVIRWLPARVKTG